MIAFIWNWIIPSLIQVIVIGGAIWIPCVIALKRGYNKGHVEGFNEGYHKALDDFPVHKR